MVRIAIPQRLKSHNASRSNSRNSSPARHSGNTLLLRTAVLRGRNLAAKDKSGTSDPYLVVTLGESKQSTPSISKTLNPEWYETFDLLITGPRCLLLEAVCWDKDRFGKDYMGEIDIAVEDLFVNGNTCLEPQWFTLKSKRGDAKRKGSRVSGEIQFRFNLIDPANPSATGVDILQKFRAITGGSPSEEKDEDLALAEMDSKDDDDDEEEEDISDETEDPSTPEAVEKRKRRLRLKRLKKKVKARAYEFSGGSDCVGIIFLEIGRITDLPPERNATRTSFDMDPFVVASLGRKTFRTKIIRHNLNPVYNEKMVFQVMRHEQQYSMTFSVVDRDKLSGNDFVGTADFPISNWIQNAPDPDPETGLYPHKAPPSEPLATTAASKSRFRLPLSRSPSSQSLKTLGKPLASPRIGGPSEGPPTPLKGYFQLDVPSPGSSVTGGPSLAAASPDPNLLTHVASNVSHAGDDTAPTTSLPSDDPDLKAYTLPVTLKNKEKWSKHSPLLYVRAKYLPYPALRQQFWRSMLKQYDADDTSTISKVELTTMLDNLGSTLKESTIDRFFNRFAAENGGTDASATDLTFDQAVICLEDQLQKSQSKSVGETVKGFLQSPEPIRHLVPSILMAPRTRVGITERSEEIEAPPNEDPSSQMVPAIAQDPIGAHGESGDLLAKDDLADDREEEHIIEVRECPICHQPRLNKRSDADIITHIATCASHDWRAVDNIVMGGFVTSSQAQRKWYSKVITKIGYGGYKLGANSANILVQDRTTGQINEERMSVYVRLGIRLLYKGLKSREMETKKIRNLLKSLSMKQGRKFDDPASASEIQPFINFHQLDMSEVLLPVDRFKNFNEFFYRKLKPEARPASAPDNAKIITSPADCRTVVFNRIDDATRIWVKGRGFSVARLLGEAYPEDVKRYTGGALGIFRLAPQDYHRFHIPVDGVMGEPKLIDGEYYTVNPMAIRSALDVYGENIRVVVPIDSAVHGRVMVICVGAMMVGSTVITRQSGEKVARAEELGYFKFGGSTLLLIFEPGSMKFDADLTDNSRDAVETLVRAGMSIGHSPDQPQFTPDMRKEEKDISNEERQDAKRRIEGSLAPRN